MRERKPSVKLNDLQTEIGLILEKIDLTKQFAHRLKDAMEAAGWYSTRSTSGVCAQTLADITGHSVQICRKYLRGEAIPEPVKLAMIAEKLKVSPGWLLFGDSHNDASIGEDNVMMNKKILLYILSKAHLLYNAPQLSEEAPDFLMELINDVSLIDTDEAQLKRIIDLAFSSLKHFTG